VLVLDDWLQIAEQLKRVANAQDDAWDTLLVALTPVLESLVRRQPIGRLRDDEDAQRDILTRVIGKLHSRDHRVIKKFVAHEDPPPLKAWIRVLVRSAAIDEMRGRPEFQRASKERLPGWFSLSTLVTAHGSKGENTLEGKQREVENLMSAAIVSARKAVADVGVEAEVQLASDWNVGVVHTRRLIKRIDHYPVVLAMVLAGHTYAEIAEASELTRREVELIVGYIEEFFHARGFAA